MSSAISSQEIGNAGSIWVRVFLSEMRIERQQRNVSGTVCKQPPVGAAGWCWLVLRNRTGTRHSDFLLCRRWAKASGVLQREMDKVESRKSIKLA